MNPHCGVDECKIKHNQSLDSLGDPWDLYECSDLDYISTYYLAESDNWNSLLLS